MRWLTEDLPGTGGSFRPGPEDFEVEEIPLYEPCGEGEHLYLRVEKTGLTTREVVRRAVECFGVAEADVGYAGLKDRHARTVQTISVRGAAPSDAGRLEGDGIAVRGALRHRNKLRVGHLAGNRFRMVVRDVEPDSEGRARAILDRLGALGLPNFYGAQRFGREGQNAEAGREVLRRGPRAAGSKWRAKFLVSALQSDLFNRYLEERMARGAFARVLVGDVLTKVASGGIFTCEDPSADQPRLERFEVSLTGPIFGHEMREALGEPGRWEAEILAAAALALEDFRRAGKLAPGTRRPLRAQVREARTSTHEGALVLEFELPAGAYATVLLDEVVKGAPPPPTGTD
jgi:tRNA pseudouridine13 synthase